MTGCHVEKLLIEDGPNGRKTCSGVQFSGGGRAYTAKARRETLLAAGAIGSPQILQLSGIGPAARLHELGIAPQVDLPAVGDNLQDHLQLRMVYRIEGARSLNTSAASRPRPTCNTTSSLCLWKNLAIRCTVFRRSRPASATCARPRAAMCASHQTTVMHRRRSRRTT
jgi:choline dehydrogenase-like flavoprotein